ncbi:AAA family ATPase [Rhodococcus sp. H36-A4]|uniref:nucleotide-binding protein n=1 Tax=Rhodococcus sp. H36-A4 TaxID=3004353 RepID=UPI0022AF2EB6|nr:AAA family ATPase [Rhodococcus sp. H36-A4]MCZ4079295.1 AAA family ATPase [Rhodococcus sp. H36-A4]
MADWQMSSWQAVRPEEPDEDRPSSITAPPEVAPPAVTPAAVTPAEVTAPTATPPGATASALVPVEEPSPRTEPEAAVVHDAEQPVLAAPEALVDPPEALVETTPDPGFRSTPVPMPAEDQHPRTAPQASLPPQVIASSALDLTNALLVKQVSPAPLSGWRRWLYSASGKRMNLGNSPRDEKQLRLVRQVDRQLVGCYRVSVLSLKGGVGKTTTTATLGSMFASIRGDRVIAVDANPDRGTLSQKVPIETPATVRNMLRDIDSLDRYSDVRGYTSQNEFRLEVLASDSDPAVSEAFSGRDYDRAVDLLEKFYSIVLTDCGTGLMHSAMDSILSGSDALVVVSSSSVDGARSASATLDWLDAHGHRDLVRSSVAVVNAVRPRAGKVDLAKVVEHFAQRCRQVVLVPFDPHLEEGAEIDLGRLKPKTRFALLELAAAVAADFPSTRPDATRMRDRTRTARS